jgi:ArsR family transcriptional regulator
MTLARTIETLTLLGDESRLRLCALLSDRELCVSELVQVTGLAQSGVSTHLGRLREAGFVRDRRKGAQSFYGLAPERLPRTAKAILDDAIRSDDATLRSDRERLAKLEAERRAGHPDALADDLERYYSPGRSWQSLAAGIGALLRLGDVLDVGCGEGAVAACIAPHCRSMTCVDLNPRLVERARDRLAAYRHVEVAEADVHDLPFADRAFDAVLLFHTLTYAERPPRALAECARVLRPGGRLVVLCLDRHEQQAITAPYGERHPGFSPRSLRSLLTSAALQVRSCEVACREPRKPHLQVLRAIADKPGGDGHSRETSRT